MKKLLLIAAFVPLPAVAQTAVEERLEINRQIVETCIAQKNGHTFKFSLFVAELCAILPESFDKSVPLGKLQNDRTEVLRVMEKKNQALRRIISINQ